MKAILINLENKTAVKVNKNGFLIVTVENKQTGVRQNGTVWVQYYDKKSANLFCRELGLVTGWWEEMSEKKEASQCVILQYLI